MDVHHFGKHLGHVIPRWTWLAPLTPKRFATPFTPENRSRSRSPLSARRSPRDRNLFSRLHDTRRDSRLGDPKSGPAAELHITSSAYRERSYKRHENGTVNMMNPRHWRHPSDIFERSQYKPREHLDQGHNLTIELSKKYPRISQGLHTRHARIYAENDKKGNVSDGSLVSAPVQKVQ
ncbi:hypothetical protein G5I_07671 [Acromyrmex echinatior]|uniref:Uncharacterized protein n=1 Tax=Acromyrmex echinatior TaxID=103372 RepID=F4WPA8_ACREC|nr:hypothetical protein G5I_07671 [Acromyrmex echinatior]